ncbi:N-acetyl-alpha-D-glucosaminyl L-malate synthase BshA [Fusobacterium necrogenes]|uniref:N-acetyl-alpha-D-glucosaminyl L-malate synthase BshA n=1 Tax=Fusobacterium necrogenes TaxID=858 RepID=A0A377GZT9_9FUSO|nr:glycosyltransferase family 4 protein [Fusobacterium necrogenes]STO32272.1 N-acetyl-alpha-D-glucosaminyl L-malate synthase BshA [Fusobacterium necrogenes]
MKKRKNILMVSHSSGGGGAEVVFEKTLDYLKEDGHKITVILPNKKGYLYEKLKYQEGIKLFILNLKNISVGPLYKNLIKIIYDFILIIIFRRKLIINENIDIIYSSTIVNIFPIILGVITKKRIVWHIHERYNDYSKIYNPKLDKIMKYLFRKSEVIFLSNKLKYSWKKRLKIKEKTKDHIIYNFIKESIEQKNSDRSVVTLGFAGTFCERKNPYLFVELIEKLNKKYKVEAIMCGSKIKEEIKKYITEKKLEMSNLKLYDYIDINEFFNKIDIFILPSYNEAWPLVAIEAMKAEVIPIITKESDLDEIFQEEKNIFYFDPNNLENLESKIEKVLYLKESEKKNLFKRNLKIIEKYSFSKNYKIKIKNLFNYM